MVLDEGVEIFDGFHWCGQEWQNKLHIILGIFPWEIGTVQGGQLEEDVQVAGQGWKRIDWQRIVEDIIQR